MTSTETETTPEGAGKPLELPRTARTIPDIDDNGDYSLASYTTLFSSNSSSSAGGTSKGEDRPQGITVILSPVLKLKRSFSERDEILAKLTEGQSARYVQMLYGNEKAVRKASFKKLEEEAVKKDDKELLKELQMMRANNEFLTNDEDEAMTDAESWLMFEYCHTLPGVCILLLYCACHMSTYEVVSSCVEQWTYPFENEDAAYFGIFLFAILLIRLSGGIWDWINKDSFNSVKFDTHNRLRLNKWDARLLRWFKRHERIRFVVTYLAFYLMLVCVNRLHDRFGELLFDQKRDLLANLPSRDSGVETLVARKLREGAYGFSFPKCESWDDPCLRTARWEKLDDADETFVVGRSTPKTFYKLMGDVESALVPLAHSVTYHSICIGVTMFFLAKMNFDVDR